MLTGKQPYAADTPIAVPIKHITDPVPRILNANPKLPEGMDIIIQKAMAKNRNERYSTAIEITSALRDLGRSDSAKLQTMASPAIKETVVSKKPVVTQKKAFSPLVVALRIVAIAVVAGGFFLLKDINTPIETEAPVINTSTSAPAFTETSVPTTSFTTRTIKRILEHHCSRILFTKPGP